MKRLAKFALRWGIRQAIRSGALRGLIEAEITQHPPPRRKPARVDETEMYQGRPWPELDRLYSFCRRELHRQADWRLGPDRVHEVAKEGFGGLSPYCSLKDQVYCDLGCGAYHPYGVSAAMFLNGAPSTIALDLNETKDKQRAAEALADLLCDCIASPSKWNWSGADESEFLGRAQQFNLNALRAGRLDEGLAGIPLRHIVTDIHDPTLEEDSIDVMTSRAVLEHFLGFEGAMDRLFALMRKGGVAFHSIDLTDHRAYFNPDYHYWSFLTEDEDWSDGSVNRLRACQIKPHFERAGFQILRFKENRDSMPEGFMEQVAPCFREMGEDELSVTTVECVLRKP